MGNKIYSIVFGDPYQTKEIEGETFGIDEDGTLRIYDADNACVAAFSSLVWAYIENVTHKSYKANSK